MKISDVFGSVNASYNEWKNLIVTAIHINRNSEISWPNRSGGTHHSIVRESTVRAMADNSQYTFLIVDGSIVQLYYRFDYRTKNIAAANLAYYCAISDIERTDHESHFAESGVSPIDDIEIYDPPVGWIRIDYDPNASERGVIHHDCHLHMSGFPDARIIVSGVPSPRQFVEFVIASAFPQVYKEHRLVRVETDRVGSKTWEYKYPEHINTLNQACMPIEDSVYKQLAHFRIPVGRIAVS